MKKRRIIDFKYLKPALLLTLIMVLVHLLQYYGEVNLNGYLGLKPRKLQGIIGVIFSPILHGDFRHLFNNLPSFFFLTWALFYFYKEIARTVFAWGWLITGFWTWIFAASGNHVGASGMVYFLVVFLFVSGLMRMEKGLIALSLAVIFYHAGIIWGVFPWEEILGDDVWRLSQQHLRYVRKVSWESHLMGAVSGGVLSYYFRKQGPQKVELPMDDDLSALEEKYGEEYWLGKNKEEEKEKKSIFRIKYVYVNRKKNDD